MEESRSWYVRIEVAGIDAVGVIVRVNDAAC